MYDINYLAVLVAAIVFFGLGALWYSPVLFGNAWVKSIGKTMEELEKDKANTNMTKSFVIMFIASFIMAYVTAHIVDLMVIIYPNAGKISLGLMTAFWVWLGYIATYVLTNVAFEDRPWKYYFVNSGYWLVGLLIIGVILNIWR